MVIYSQFEASAQKLVFPTRSEFASQEIEIQRKAPTLQQPHPISCTPFDRRLTRRRYYFVNVRPATLSIFYRYIYTYLRVILLLLLL